MGIGKAPSIGAADTDVTPVRKKKMFLTQAPRNSVGESQNIPKHCIFCFVLIEDGNLKSVSTYYNA